MRTYERKRAERRCRAEVLRRNPERAKRVEGPNVFELRHYWSAEKGPNKPDVGLLGREALAYEIWRTEGAAERESAGEILSEQNESKDLAGLLWTAEGNDH